jgi:preprotein translocase subunit SecE
MYVTGEQAVVITLGMVVIFAFIFAVLVWYQDWHTSQKQQHQHH